MKYNLDTLKGAADRGEPLSFLFFWSHQPDPSGALGPGCLSQWWDAGFVVDGQRYPSAEHFMMAGKARLFADDATLAQILSAPTPASVKALGRDVRGFDEARWAAERYALIREGNVAKFTQNARLRSFLLGTGDSVLAEASPTDVVWGIGLAKEDARAEDPHAWRGLNLLGFALMEVRDALA